MGATTSIRAGGVGVSMSRDALASSSNSLTTSPTMDLTNTSLTSAEVPAGRVLGECGGSGLAGVSSSRPRLGRPLLIRFCWGLGCTILSPSYQARNLS